MEKGINVILRIAETAVAVDEDLALLQTVHTGGQLQPQYRLLGVGQEGDPGLVIGIGAEITHSLEIEVGQGEQYVAAPLADN